MVVLSHALILSVSVGGLSVSVPAAEGVPQPGLPGSDVPVGTAMATASALQATVVSNPSPNPIQRSSMSSGGTGWNDAGSPRAIASAHTGRAPAAPVRPVARLSS